MCYTNEKLPKVLELQVEKELYKKKRLKMADVTFKKYVLRKQFQEGKLCNKELKLEQRMAKLKINTAIKLIVSTNLSTMASSSSSMSSSSSSMS